MNEEQVKQLASEMNLELDEHTAEALESAILAELRTLQEEPATGDQTTRRQVLTAALQRSKPAPPQAKSTALVTLTRGDLAEVVAAAVAGSRAESSPEEKLRKGVQVAATQARKDFRSSRSWPLAGFGVVAAFAWSQRETVAADFGLTGTLTLSTLTLAFVLLALLWYLAAWAVTRRDERMLRMLYLPETHAEVLGSLSGREIFAVPDFRRELRDGAYSTRTFLWPSILSTVDLRAAIDDATDLAIERLVKLGVIEPVESWSGLEYRLAEKFFGQRE